MTKKFLSMLLAIAMVVSMFAGLATTASAAESMTLTFALNANPGGWPTANSTTTANYTYTLDGVDYTFALKNVKSNTGYLMLTQPAALGLPVISGYKLTKVVANNSSGCSTSVNVGISNSDTSASYITGGDAQKWATTNSSYTYNLTDTVAGTMYYLYATTKNAQIVSLELTYAPEGAAPCEHTNTTEVEAVAATCTENGYTAGVFCTDCQTYISGHETIPATGHTWDEGVETTAPSCTEDGVKTYTCTVEDCGATKTEAIAATGHSYVDGVCSVCSAVEPTYYDYAKTDLAAITAEHKVIITMTDGTTVWALSSANGTSAAPAAVVVTPSEDKINSNNSSLVWNITNTDGVLTIVPDGATDSTLYCTDANNGVRVGTSTSSTFSNAFSIDETSGYLKVTTGNNTRYLGVYKTTPDWRCYTNTTGNTAGQTLAFYAYLPTSTDPDPVDCQHTNATEVAEVPATCTAAGTAAGVVCADCGTVISGCDEIPALGHTATAGTYVCNEDGTHAYTCSVCTETVTENCTAEEVEEIPATCTSYSSTEYECPVCGGVWRVIGTEYAPHTYENGVCSVCGDALDKYVKVTDLSTLAAGDTVVIYYPSGNMALTSTASGTALAGAAGQVDTTGNGMMYVDGAALMTVTVNEAGQYQFSIVDAESNTLYLTSGATGNSLTFAAAPAEGDDYTLWTIVADESDSTIAYIKSVNASYSGKVQALEYYNSKSCFTTYSENTTAAYQFNFYKPYVEGEHVHSYTSEVTTAATCLTDGLMTYTCACGDSYTEAIAATGHSYAADAVAGTACANGCGHTLIEAKKTVALEDGMTVIFYSANISMAMDSLANGSYINAIAPNTTAGDTLLIDDGVALMTVEAVEGGYRFKLGDNYLSYRGGRNTLVFEPLTDAVVTDEEAGTTTDYTVFALENGNALYCVNGDYDYNGNLNKLYLEAYGDHYTSYNCSDNTGAAFVFTFYTTSEVCDHVADAGTVTTEATCTEPGVKTYTCTICGKVLYTEEIPATGHSYVDGVCENCGEPEPNFEGDWYIAVARSTGNYFYMENTMQNTAGTRFTAVDSGLTALPEAITEGAMAEYVFHIAKNADGNYVMYSDYVEGDNKYVGWNGGTTNTATLVAEADARAFTVVKNDDGTVKLELIKSADETTAEAAARYFSMNGSTGNDYFAWYKSGQRSDLTLIPVSGEIHVHSYTVTESVDVTCTTDGSTTYTCSCGKTYTETVTATGHAIELVEAVDATCTTDGNEAYYKCSKCGALFSDAEGTTALDAIPTIAATGHSYTYVDNGDGTHTATCSVCNDTVTADHTFVDGTCVCGAAEGPIAAADLVFFNKSLVLKSYTAFNVICKYSVLNNYDSYYVVFERYDSSTGTVDRVQTAGATSTASANYHSFEYPVLSYMMTDEITATLYAVKDGITYVGETYTNSVRAYALGKIGTATEAMKSVYANLLNYGARAQDHMSYKTDDLATVGLDSYESYIVTSVPTTNNTSSITTDGYTEIQLMTRALGLNAAVELQYVLKKTTAYAKEDLYAVYSFTRNGETIEGRIDGEDFALVSGYITIKVSALYATEGNTPVSLTVYSKADDSRLSETWTYSIESHVNLKVTGEPTTTQQKVLVALMNYYNAVSAAY